MNCTSYLWGFLLLPALLCCLSRVEAQDVLTYEEYIEKVRTHHPIMFRGKLLQDQAISQNLQALGNFDPVFVTTFDNKYFADKNYYSLLKGGLKIPLRFGPDIEVGYSNNRGSFLNSADFVPDRGLWNGGISVPVGRGLLVDQRRTEYNKSKVAIEASNFERGILENDLIYMASLTYLFWQEQYQKSQIVEEGIKLARIRLEGTVSSFINGDKPAIDTLETYIILQDRLQDSISTAIAINQAKYQAELYLWYNGETPVFIEDGVVPEPLSNNGFDSDVQDLIVSQDQYIEQHPELLIYDTKLQSLALDQKLNKENLKPDLRLSYNPLGRTNQEQLFVTPDINDYKFAASLYFPLLLRKERGKVKETAIKIESTEFDQVQKLQTLQTKFNNYKIEIQGLDSQLDINTANVINYNTMLLAENRKFSLGESSVFLVNSREQKYLDALLKNNEVTTKLIKARLGLIHSLARFIKV